MFTAIRSASPGSIREITRNKIGALDRAQPASTSGTDLSPWPHAAQKPLCLLMAKPGFYHVPNFGYRYPPMMVQNYQANPTPPF